MRMAMVNITVPDELLDQARAERPNISRLAAAALSEELERRTKVAGLDAYLSALHAELGPTSEQESISAREVGGSGAAREPAPRRFGAPGTDGVTLVLDAGGLGALAGNARSSSPSPAPVRTPSC